MIYRLPTKEEWKLACGPDPDDLDEYAWYARNSGEMLHEVAQKKSNKFGLYDMLGNVQEWSSDAFRPGGYERAALGGSYSSEPLYCRAGQYDGYSPYRVKNNLGFRLARPTAPPDDSPCSFKKINELLWVQTTPVTRACWQNIMGSIPNNTDNQLVTGDPKNAPITYVSWNHCQVFIRRLNDDTRKESK